MDDTKKLTLLPYGPPPSTPESQEKCRGLLLYCDADLDRIHDKVWRSPARYSLPPGVKRREFDQLESFLDFARRLTALRSPLLSAMVVLTQTCPIHRMVIQARQRIEAELPTLARALWVIYADPYLDASPRRQHLGPETGPFRPPRCGAGGCPDLDRHP